MNPDYECSDRRKGVLGGDDLKVIQEAVRAAISTEVKNAVQVIVEVERKRIVELIRSEHLQLCPFDPETKPAVQHVIGIAKDLGKGDIHKGLREIRKNEDWVKHIRTRSERYNTHIMLVLIGVLVISLASTIWTGIKALAN